MPDITRRDSLQIGGTVAVGYGAAKVLHELRRVGVDIPGSGEFQFSREQPRFRIGWHALQTDDIRLNTALIGGELDIRSLYYYESGSIPPYIEEDYEPKAKSSSLHGSTSSSEESRQIHKDVLTNAKKTTSTDCCMRRTSF